MRLHYLPPGTLTRLRVKWMALGVLLGAGLMAALAMWAAAIRPAELPYRAPAPTHQARPGGEGAAPRPPLELGPCPLRVKDCAVLPGDIVRPLPEPGTLALVGLALAASVGASLRASLFARRKACARP